MKNYSKTFRLLSLGCAKNLVDSEVMLGLLREEGWEPSPHSRATVAIINTCAFIKEAKMESLTAILEAAQAKERGQYKYLVVTGCLPQRYKSTLTQELPEVDLFLGLENIPHVAKFLNKLGQRKLLRREFVSRPNFLYDHQTPRLLSTAPGSAYIKIAEGCANCCAYCAIPQIRGKLRSRKISSVIKEAEWLVGQGVKEINLIAQDITNYGRDLRRGGDLTKLLRGLAKVPGLKWIRLLYAHPAHIDNKLISVIKEEEKICKYLDLPLQHIDDQILTAMNRPYTSNKVWQLLEQIRKEMPEIVLRTSLIVGFPGETEKKFQKLLDFVKEAQFDHLGVFIYSREEGTKAAKLKGHIPERIKEERFRQIMLAQRKISWRKQKAKVGRVMEVLIEKPIQKKGILWQGRTPGQAPEVDGVTFLNRGKAALGEIKQVLITKATAYDLYGEILGADEGG
ncbi:MAG: 30S ribosomal protein S12 methylthiotransferase RimO [Thermodesulfobacteriota bacterium]